MLKIFFGEVVSGRLKRLPFLGYYFLLNIIIIAIVLGGVFMLGMTEQLIGGNLQEVQAKIAQNLGLSAVIGGAILAIAIMFASLNLVAKRVRDMGLSGWWITLATMLVLGVAGAILGGDGIQDPSMQNPYTQVITILQAIFILFLLLVPSNAFGRNT